LAVNCHAIIAKKVARRSRIVQQRGGGVRWGAFGTTGRTPARGCRSPPLPLEMHNAGICHEYPHRRRRPSFRGRKSRRADFSQTGALLLQGRFLDSEHVPPCGTPLTPDRCPAWVALLGYLCQFLIIFFIGPSPASALAFFQSVR